MPGRRRRQRGRSRSARGRGRRSRRCPRRRSGSSRSTSMLAGLTSPWIVDERAGTATPAPRRLRSGRGQRSTMARRSAGMWSSFGRSSGRRVTSQSRARCASGWVKPASARSSRATAAPTERRRAGLAGPAREGGAVDEGDELDGMVGALDRDGARRASLERAPRGRDRHPRVGPERMLHREHLHLDDAGRIGRVADLEDERALVGVDPEVAVALAVERRGLRRRRRRPTERPRPRARSAPREEGLRGRRGSRRATISGLQRRPPGSRAHAAVVAVSWASVSNCSSSVEPFSASVELMPPVIAWSTSSK